MDCGVPARVTYWSHHWDPAREAISKEINALRTGPRAGAPVVAFSLALRTRVRVSARAITLSGRRWLVLRALAAAAERWGDVSHVFGGRESWHLFRALGRRPLLLTAVTAMDGTALPDLPAVHRVVVETESAVADWVHAGMAPDRVHLIRPGLDLAWFQASPPPPRREPFTLLFASTPQSVQELEPRGILLMIELARRRPDVKIVVPWRRWGQVEVLRATLDRLNPPSNFVVTFEDAIDMRTWYADAHATIVCMSRSGGKACPNFVLEGLASGRPCLATTDVGIADLLQRFEAGIVTDRTVDALAAAVDELTGQWPVMAIRARQLAETYCDLTRYRVEYERLYSRLKQEGGPRRG